MIKHTEKPLTEEELQRYKRALELWDLALQKQEEELDERENTLDEAEIAAGESLGFDDDGGNIIPRNITPQKFVTTIKSCGQKCYEGGEHAPGCARMIYLEVERLGKL